MSVHPLITNSLIVAVLDSLLYGVFLLLNAFCTSLFIRRYKSNSTEDARSYWFKNPMIVGALSLFICVTGHWTCTIFDFFQGFVAFKGGTQPVEYYDDPSRPSRIARVAFLSLSVLIADGMMCIFVIFIESAFIYCAWGFIFIVALACGKQAGSVFSDTYPTIAGIAFALISARVGAESARRSNRIQSFTNPISRVHFETFQSTRDHESGLGPAYSMQVHESQGNSQMDPREIGYGTQAQQKNGRAGL
uniref:Uncharacterized protein n=1 Tax=Moniliophthora roreri TaxID=221103 RepID=A0A0W0F8J4_MONRR